jgi:hypothetical protein
MAEEDEQSEYLIHGELPVKEWQEFIKTHLRTGKGASARISTGRPGEQPKTCTALGCPSTHPISGTALTGCRVVTESDGSTTIKCTYKLNRA